MNKLKTETTTTADPYELVGLWTANNDARAYTIIGDPAVRLPVADNDAADQSRPVIQATHVPGSPKTDVQPASDAAIDPGLDDGSTTATYRTDGAHHVAERDGKTGLDPELVVPFSPLPAVPEKYRENHPELYAAWVKHIEAGYRNNDNVFKQILDAFLWSHNSTVIMYWLMFTVGMLFFVTAVILALHQGQVIAGAVFGGLSVVSFLTYFVSRPTQAIEENLQFITWLGIIYNSYWTHQAWSFDKGTAQENLDKATADAIKQLIDLIDKHADTVRNRPGFMKWSVWRLIEEQD